VDVIDMKPFKPVIKVKGFAARQSIKLSEKTLEKTAKATGTWSGK
jgi:hypothetical protein